MNQWLHKLITRRKAPALLSQVFLQSKKVTPYLKGSYGRVHSDCIAIGNPNTSRQLELVYRSVAQAEPLAGKAYWLTRTWDLVCWQPVYVAFISIYGLRSLPCIENIAQYRYKQFITGYRFSDQTHWHGEPEVLVPDAARALVRLTKYYREQIAEWTRIGPGFTNHLYADLLLSCLIKLQEHDQSLSNQYIRGQATLWLSESGLSLNHLLGLIDDDVNGRLKLVRTSCCLTYKCELGRYCDDCPKAR